MMLRLVLATGIVRKIANIAALDEKTFAIAAVRYMGLDVVGDRSRTKPNHCGKDEDICASFPLLRA
jgi:hypothetical protein